MTLQNGRYLDIILYGIYIYQRALSGWKRYGTGFSLSCPINLH